MQERRSARHYWIIMLLSFHILISNTNFSPLDYITSKLKIQLFVVHAMNSIDVIKIFITLLVWIYWLLMRHLLWECAQEFCDNILKLGIWCVADCTFGGNCLKKSGFVCLDMLQEFNFESGDFGWIHFIQITSDTTEDNGNLSKNKNWSHSLHWRLNQINLLVLQ